MISEEDFEEVESEIVPKNQLQVLIKETALEPQLAEEFQINFEEHFNMTATWAKKAKKIIVTNANQTVMMEEARTARLFLAKKRQEIERFRVARKEYYLKGGRAIDKVANFLKDTIIPIEEHLDRQEHFVELQKKAEDERLLAKARAEEEVRIAEEAKREAEEKERLKIENEKLRKEAEEREKKNKEEIEKIRKVQEEDIRKEREKVESLERDALQRKQTELKEEADRLREEERLSKAGDSEQMIAFRLRVEKIQFPQVRSVENKRILEEAKSHLYLAVHKIKFQEEI